MENVSINLDLIKLLPLFSISLTFEVSLFLFVRYAVDSFKLKWCFLFCFTFLMIKTLSFLLMSLISLFLPFL